MPSSTPQALKTQRWTGYVWRGKQGVVGECKTALDSILHQRPQAFSIRLRYSLCRDSSPNSSSRMCLNTSLACPSRTGSNLKPLAQDAAEEARVASARSVLRCVQRNTEQQMSKYWPYTQVLGHYSTSDSRPPRSVSTRSYTRWSHTASTTLAASSACSARSRNPRTSQGVGSKQQIHNVVHSATII